MKIVKLDNINWQHTHKNSIESMGWEMDSTTDFNKFSEELSMLLQFMSNEETDDNKIVSFDIKVLWISEEELKNR